ncbi:MAG: MBL fold metallo-hydrolase, partial [Gammaproteobacteria bacterium]|nr:MBL fold metallo-hydrolase [Gammaproteobacteria bacterium]
MRFASLGSGSKGNAMVVACGDTHILLDCGLPMKQLQPALARLQLDFSSLDAVFITHEHADHIRGLGSLCRR